MSGFCSAWVLHTYNRMFIIKNCTGPLPLFLGTCHSHSVDHAKTKAALTACASRCHLGTRQSIKFLIVSKMNCRRSSSFCVVVVADGKHCVLCVTTLSQIKLLETWRTMSCKHSILNKLVWLGCRRWRNPVFGWISFRCRTFVRLVP